MLAFGAGSPTQAICSWLIAEALGYVRYPILPIISPDASKERLKLRNELAQIASLRRSRRAGASKRRALPLFDGLVEQILKQILMIYQCWERLENPSYFKLLIASQSKFIPISKSKNILLPTLAATCNV